MIREGGKTVESSVQDIPHYSHDGALRRSPPLPPEEPSGLFLIARLVKLFFGRTPQPTRSQPFPYTALPDHLHWT